MINDAVESWRSEHYAVLAEWCTEAKAGFDLIIKGVISSDEITVEDFVSVIKIIMLAGNFTQTELSQITTIASGRLGAWQNSVELPEPDMRRLVLELCYSSLHTKKAPPALVQMANVMDIKNPPQRKVACDDDGLSDRLWRKISELELTIRPENCLKNDNINYVGQLIRKTEAEMLRINNFGRKSLNEIKEVLLSMGLRLEMDSPAIDQFLSDLAEGKTGPESID